MMQQNKKLDLTPKRKYQISVISNQDLPPPEVMVDSALLGPPPEGVKERLSTIGDMSESKVPL